MQYNTIQYNSSSLIWNFYVLSSQTSTTLPQFVIWMLNWTEFTHLQTMSIVSLEHACIICQLCTTCHSLSSHTVNILVLALICTRVDFSNSISVGVSSRNLSKLKSIIHTAVSLNDGLPRFTSYPMFPLSCEQTQENLEHTHIFL